MKLLFQTLLDDLGQFIPIQLMGTAVTDVRQCLITVRNNRRTFIRPNRCHDIDPVRNFIRIGNNNLFCLVTAKILKLCKHLLCCPQIKRSLIVCILKSLTCHDNPAVNLILRIQKMYVTRCYHRLSVFFTKLHNPAVDVPDIFHAVNGRNPFGFDHELIVPKRLDFQIIIKVHKPRNLGFRLIFE